LGPDGQPLSPVGDEGKGAELPPKSKNLSWIFLNYIASLGFQAMIFLGEMPNPFTNQMDKNLKQAKFLIDTLSLLKDKDHG